MLKLNRPNSTYKINSSIFRNQSGNNSKLINQTSKRLYLFEKIIKDERCTLENIKYFARLYKNISPIYQDLLNESNECCSTIIKLITSKLYLNNYYYLIFID